MKRIAVALIVLALMFIAVSCEADPTGGPVRNPEMLELAGEYQVVTEGTGYSISERLVLSSDGTYMTETSTVVSGMLTPTVTVSRGRWTVSDGLLWIENDTSSRVPTYTEESPLYLFLGEPEGNERKVTLSYSEDDSSDTARMLSAMMVADGGSYRRTYSTTVTENGNVTKTEVEILLTWEDGRIRLDSTEIQSVSGTENEIIRSYSTTVFDAVAGERTDAYRYRLFNDTVTGVKTGTTYVLNNDLGIVSFDLPMMGITYTKLR